jgi:acetyl esterase/lipase
MSGDCGSVQTGTRAYLPAAHDDAERGGSYLANAEKLGVDKNRITLCGDSAGGHLALVTALRLKTKGLASLHSLFLSTHARRHGQF